jgi:hypothetical protein
MHVKLEHVPWLYKKNSSVFSTICVLKLYIYFLPINQYIKTFVHKVNEFVLFNKKLVNFEFLVYRCHRPNITNMGKNKIIF